MLMWRKEMRRGRVSYDDDESKKGMPFAGGDSGRKIGRTDYFRSLQAEPTAVRYDCERSATYSSMLLPDSALSSRNQEDRM
jgi:hypothetical protein